MSELLWGALLGLVAAILIFFVALALAALLALLAGVYRRFE